MAGNVHGKGIVFKLDDSGGTLRDLTTYVDGVTGLPGARQLSDVTVAGSVGTKNIPGLQDCQFTVTGNFDSTATTGPIPVLNSLRTAASTATYEYGPEGSTTGSQKYTGECWLMGYTIDAKVTDKVPFSAVFRTDNGVTLTTY